MENIIAEGRETWTYAWIENPQVNTGWLYGEPSKLSISVPRLMVTAVGPSWAGGLSIGVAATIPPAPPGIYDVVATSSGTDWVNELPPEYTQSTLDWLVSLAPPAWPTDLCITNKLTIVGITNLTADRYHVANGDTVTFTAAMTPVNAFEFVHWDAWTTGQTYQVAGDPLGSGRKPTAWLQSPPRVAQRPSACPSLFTNSPMRPPRAT